MIKFDLTSAYHFVQIYEPHTKFLGFSWNDKGGNPVYYRFVVMPFGLSSACYLWTKLCRPLIKKWRGEGLLVTMFLDDGLGCSSTYESVLRLSSHIKSDLLRSGFIPNAKKCIWTPVQNMEFLGCDLDTLEGTISVPKRRLSKANSAIKELIVSAMIKRFVFL